MTDEQRVFVRGVKGRGSEVIKILEDLGGKVPPLDLGGNPKYIYFISHDGDITCMLYESEGGKIIMDFYREIKLPEQWKDGDVLVSDDGLFFVLRGDFELGVKKECAGAYCCVNEHQVCLSGHFSQIGSPHLASPSEVEHFHELMHKYGKDWDAQKKEVVDWKWKPQIKERYYYIDNDGEIMSDTWGGFPTDDDRYNFGNCFPTKEEAEAMAEKIKKLLKGE